MKKPNKARAIAMTAIALSCVLSGVLGGPPWEGFRDKNQELKTKAFDFGAAGGGNENYYDGDFADIDRDGRMDRALISRYGLLWNTGGGVMLPVSTQQVGKAPNTSPSLTGYLFGDEVQIGNDAVQWADIDGDGDLDSIQGGNGEPFTIQVNRHGRFSVKKKYSCSALDIVNIDLERDGDVDLAAAHAFCSNALCGHGCPQQDCQPGNWPKEFHLWVNDGRGNFTDEARRRGLDVGVDLIVGIVAGDVDGDRDFDLLLLCGCSDGTTEKCSRPGMTRGVTLARNDGKGFFTLEPMPFSQPVRPIGPLSSGFNQGMSLGDIDDDGDLDLVIALERDVAPHPHVGHAIFMNDGTGKFTEGSDARFDTGDFTGFLRGGNGKLMDMDYDGDLDFLVFNRDRNSLDLFLNDGRGIFTYDPVHSIIIPGQPTALGNDTDVTDLDGDGTYDVWVGSAGTIVHPMINTYRDPSGLPADVPRDLKVLSAAGGITISFRSPSFAANVRHYRVYRGLAPELSRKDRLLWKTIANSAHEDEGFAAPITRHTTTEYLGDPDVELLGGEIRYTDRSAAPGITYYYSVTHVGTENTESQPTEEVSAAIDAPPPAADTTPPLLDILSPDSQWWSPFPRIVLQYADGESGIDEATLAVYFNLPLGSGDPATGGLPAGENFAGSFERRDGNAYIHALKEPQGLPQGLVTLTASISDRSGNEVTKTVTFNINVTSAQPPIARLSFAPEVGDAPLEVTFSGSASSDSDGVVMGWEWYFGDGKEAIGHDVTHRYEKPGTYDAFLLVRDNDGNVATAKRSITVLSPEPVLFRRGDTNCDGTVDTSDAITTLTWLFRNGPSPCCAEAADSNGDAEVDVSDPVFLLLWKYAGGTQPPPPGPLECGPSSNASNSLYCVSYPEERC